jgi:hypothetical protein
MINETINVILISLFDFQFFSINLKLLVEILLKFLKHTQAVMNATIAEMYPPTKIKAIAITLLFRLKLHYKNTLNSN